MKTRNKIIWIAFCLIALCFWALINHYPLFFNNDSAVYIDVVNNNYAPPDRPVTYGIWLHTISLGWSLWLVVIVQAIIVMYLVYKWFKYFSLSNSAILCFIYILLSSLLMGAAFEVSWLMPDVFTSISALSLILLLLASKIKKMDLVIVSLLLVISITMHNSHLFLVFSMLALLLIGYLNKNIKSFYKKSGLLLNRLLMVFGIILLSIFLSSFISYSYGGSWKSSKGGTTFLLANMIEMGIIDPYLTETCADKNYNLCQYKDSIPNNFLWDENSPIKQNGGWEGNEEEYKTIVIDALTTPKYLVVFIRKSIMNTFKQFFRFETGY